MLSNRFSRLLKLSLTETATSVSVDLPLSPWGEAARAATPIREFGGFIACMIQHDVARKEVEAQKVAAEGLTPHKVRLLATLLKDAFEADLQEASARLQETLSDDDLGELHDIMRVDLNRFTLAQLDEIGMEGLG